MNTPSAIAVKNSISSLMPACATTRAASTRPCRHTWPGRRMRSTAATMSGMKYCPEMFGWPIVCEIIAGAKPRKAPATAAAGRERPSSRLSTQYQAAAVPTRASVVKDRLARNASLPAPRRAKYSGRPQKTSNPPP